MNHMYHPPKFWLEPTTTTNFYVLLLLLLPKGVATLSPKEGNKTLLLPQLGNPNPNHLGILTQNSQMVAQEAWTQA